MVICAMDAITVRLRHTARLIGALVRLVDHPYAGAAKEVAVAGQAIGLLIGAVGGTAFVVFNSSRIPPPYGLAAAVLAVLALVGLVVLLVRRRRVDEEASGPDGGSGMFSRGYRSVVIGEV